MIGIEKCLIGKKSPKHKQFCQIWSHLKMSNNPAKYEVLIKQYLRSILACERRRISGCHWFRRK